MGVEWVLSISDFYIHRVREEIRMVGGDLGKGTCIRT